MNDSTPLKKCSKCQQLYPATTEYWHKGHDKFGLRSPCKRCRSQASPTVDVADGYRLCTKCNEIKPSTPEYFNRDKKGSDGLSAKCKECLKIYKKQYYLENKEKVNKKNSEWHYANREHANELSRLWHHSNKQRASQSAKNYYAENKERIKKRSNRWYHANHKQAREQQRDYYNRNKDRYYELSVEWRLKNPQKRREICQRYHRKHPHIARISAENRRARKKKLPNTFTVEQWEYCLDYFNYTCPACDSQLRDLFGNVEPHADHWIPLSYEGDDNPGTVAANMICLCNTCNLSKGAKLPDVWLKEIYNIRKANKILEHIEAYIEHVKNRE